MLLRGDCLEQLKTLEENSIDSLVTDPPAGISFMGKEWDKGHNFIENMQVIFAECLRVLKPGAHGLVWALPRTSHWTATALEKAGFEVRDVVTHLFGSGFPKSLNLGEGRGTALKPAAEFWILVRKPCSEKTVAANVLKHGTGGINIDASRIGMSEADREAYIEKRQSFKNTEVNHGWKNSSETLSVEKYIENSSQGRFPANLVLDEVAAEMLDEQSGDLGCSGRHKGSEIDTDKKGTPFGNNSRGPIPYFDKGGASRFFYVAKASKRDRNEGLEGMPEKTSKKFDGGEFHSASTIATERKNQNFHPTVKSTKLMEYLITLVTPPGGTVLDCFMGSGSTGVAAKRLGFEFIGIEKDPEYFEIAEKRIGA